MSKSIFFIIATLFMIVIRANTPERPATNHDCIGVVGVLMLLLAFGAYLDSKKEKL